MKFYFYLLAFGAFQALARISSGMCIASLERESTDKDDQKPVEMTYPLLFLVQMNWKIQILTLIHKSCQKFNRRSEKRAISVAHKST